MKKKLVYLFNFLLIILLVFTIYFLKNNHKKNNTDDKENVIVNDNNKIKKNQGMLDIFRIPNPPGKLVFNNYYYYYYSIKESNNYLKTKFIGFFINFNEKNYWEKYDNNKSFLYAYSMENRIRTYTDIDDGYTKNRFELYAKNDTYDFLKIKGHNVYKWYKKDEKYEEK